MRERSRSRFYKRLAEQGQLGRAWFACFFFFIVAMLATYLLAYDTGELEQTIPLIDHLAPNSPDEVAIGDIVLVHGIVTSDMDPTVFSTELMFRPVFKVRRGLDRWRGYQKGGPWKSSSETDWTAPEARLGPWKLSEDILKYARDGDRSATAMSEFDLSTQMAATDIESDDTEIVFRHRGTKYRLQYIIWPANMPYTVVAKVAASGTLVPFNLGPDGQHEMAIMTPGTLADAAISRSSMLLKKLMVLALLGFSVVLFWWLVSLTFDWRRFGKMVMTAIVLGPLAIAIQPPLIYHVRYFVLATGVSAICLTWMAIYRTCLWWRDE